MISRLICWASLLCTLLPLTIQAQTTEADIKARFMDKPLYLRGWWRNDNLHFGPSGRLINDSKLITFTLGGFDLKKIQIKKDKLVLEGTRVGLELAQGQITRVPLHESIKIEVDTAPNGNYFPALDAIFVDGLAGLVPSMPTYWQDYAKKNFPPPSLATPATEPVASLRPDPLLEIPHPSAQKPYRIGGGIKPPRLLHSVEPPTPEAVHNLKYGGTTLINLWVGPDGIPSHLNIVDAAGMGLDECALAAAQQYKFAPAMKDDKPVLVELNIEIKFSYY